MSIAADQWDRHLVLLATISQQLAVLIQRSGSHTAAKVSQQDLAALVVLLPAIVASYRGQSVFTSRDAIEHANSIPHVLAALKGAVGSAPTPRQVGKLLARAEGIEIAGLRLMRSAEMKEGWLWHVRRI